MDYGSPLLEQGYVRSAAANPTGRSPQLARTVVFLLSALSHDILRSSLVLPIPHLNHTLQRKTVRDRGHDHILSGRQNDR